MATLLQVHLKTVYRLAKEGAVPGIRIGRRWRFRRRDVVDLVSSKHERLRSAR